MSHDTRRRASASNPCPLCRQPSKGCSWPADGEGDHFCRGTDTPPDGWYDPRNGEPDATGFRHFRRATGATRQHPRVTTGTKTAGPPARDFPADAARFAAALRGQDREWLQRRLNLPPGAFDCLPLVGAFEWTATGPTVAFPEVDARNNVVGIVRRIPRADGTDEKKAVTGSKRGLTLPTGWRDRSGPVLVVEGPSDAAALTAGGLSAVGTYAAGQGAKLLAELLADWPAERGILVVGENDAKPDGSWPGKDGATRLAGELAKALRRTVAWALTPDGAKDARAWMTHLDRGETPWPERGTKFLAKLRTTAETVNPPAATAGPDARPKFQVGQRVSPTDRENVGTVTEVLAGDRYQVHFVGENGEADKVFRAADLRPWPPPADGDPGGGKLVVPDYQPFPTDALPPAVKEFVASVAASVGCDPCFAALPALALVGAAVGGALVARPKRGWNEVPVLWAVVVGDSGTAKSPAADPVSAVAHAIEDALEEEYERAVEQFKEDVAAYRATMDAREEEGDPSDPPAKPVPPARVYFTADDITIERLIENLRTSPRGILMLQDELANWFGSFGRYKGKAGGSDAAKWLGMFDGRPVGYQRKTASPGTPRDVRVKRAIVGVSGGIQPGILAEALSNPAYLNSGLAARLVFAMPPKRCVRWTDAEPDADADARFRRVVHALRALPFDPKGAVPWVGLSGTARAEFAKFHDDMAEAAEGHDGGGMAAAVPKLVRVGLRLALIHHCATEADAGRDPGKDGISEQSMRAGIELAKWFEAEAERVYAMLAEKPEDRAVRRLAELVARKGGRATARDLMRSNKRFKTTADAEAALDALLSAGLGQWEDTPTSGSGRPANRVFVLGGDPRADGRQKPTEPADGGEDGPDSDADVPDPRADKRSAGRRKPPANPLETSDSDGVSAFVGCRPDTSNATEGDPTAPTDPPPAKVRREYVPDPLRGETGRGGR